VDGLTFDQWLLFMAVSFRARYRALARHAFPHLEERLPLVRAGKLHVVVVNAGEAVHFVFTATDAPEPTDCRHVTLAPPEGLQLRDWAWLHEEDYKRFVERAIPGERLGSFHVFPDDGDEHARAVMAADAMARAHAAELRA
jgi:hypothetical protein